MFPSVVDERIGAVDAAIDGLADIDPASLDQEALARYVTAMHRLQSRMDAAATRAVGGFDRYGDPEGAVTTAAWLAWRCRVKRSQAKASVSRARALRGMPEVAAAYDAGAVTSEHVRLLAAAHRAAPELFAKVEADLVERAGGQFFERFARGDSSGGGGPRPVLHARDLRDPV